MRVRSSTQAAGAQRFSPSRLQAPVPEGRVSAGGEEGVASPTASRFGGPPLDPEVEKFFTDVRGDRCHARATFVCRGAQIYLRTPLASADGAAAGVRARATHLLFVYIRDCRCKMLSPSTLTSSNKWAESSTSRSAQSSALLSISSRPLEVCAGYVSSLTVSYLLSFAHNVCKA